MRDPIDEVDKAPAEELWFGLDFAALGWLPDDEFIVSAAWDLSVESGEDDEETTLVADDDNTQPEEDSTQAWVRLTGGTAGVDYIATVLVTTTTEVGEYSLRVRCR